MIYDCILFNGEIECFEIRHEELKELDVTHIIVQSGKTFTGNKKKGTYSVYYPNVELIMVNDMPDNCDAWTREAHQRNAIMRGLVNAKDDDIIIISDADEIPRAEAIKKYKSEMGLTALKMDNFWYKFNCFTERQTWVAPRIMMYKYLKTATPNEVRNSGYESVIENAGWHWSYLGNSDYIINKLESFSHQEYNKPKYKDKKKIEQQVELGESLWGNSKFEFIPIDETFPKHLVENQEKFDYLIHKI